MNYFLKTNKTLLTYSLIVLTAIPIFGVKFFISFIGNILLLIFLIPLLLFLLIFIGLNFYKSKINLCNNCGTISLDNIDTCKNCGAKMDLSTKTELEKKPSESTIEINAEEIK